MASTSFKDSFRQTRDKIWARKASKVTLHRSFHRSYREDYERALPVPGFFQHVFSTLKLLCSHWQLFGGLLIVAMIMLALLVGVMSEGTYAQFQEILDSSAAGDLGNVAKSALTLISVVSAGGFVGRFSETQAIFTILVFLIIWLVTIYLLRLILAGEKPRLRDGLFNALAPLLSTCIVAVVALLDLAPIWIFIVVLSAAVTTGLLSTPLYALVFLAFAALMILLSLYLLSSSVVALIAVSAPGVYPITALHTAGDIVAGRRMRFCLRIVFGAFIIVVAWALIMVPLILLDSALKANIPALAGFPFIPACLLFMTPATFIYVAAYLYLFYRRMLDAE